MLLPVWQSPEESSSVSFSLASEQSLLPLCEVQNAAESKEMQAA